MDMDKDNMCQISFMCRDSKVYPCIYRREDPKTHCKHTTSKTSRGVCNSSVAMANTMIRHLNRHGLAYINHNHTMEIKDQLEHALKTNDLKPVETALELINVHGEP